jgi:hypothetical protein
LWQVSPLHTRRPSPSLLTGFVTRNICDMLLRILWKRDYNRRNMAGTAGFLGHRENVRDFYLFHHSPLEAQCVVHIESLAGPCSRCPIKNSAVVLDDSPFLPGEGGLVVWNSLRNHILGWIPIGLHDIAFQQRAHGKLSFIGLQSIHWLLLGRGTALCVTAVCNASKCRLCPRTVSP